MSLEVLLRENGVWMKGHFVLDESTHSSEFIAAELGLCSPNLRQAVPEAVAALVDDDTDVLAAASPEDIALMQLVAMKLRKPRARAKFMFTANCSPDDGEMRFNAPFSRLMRGKKVTIVSYLQEDIRRAGQIVEAVRMTGATPVAIVCAVLAVGRGRTDRVPVIAVVEADLKEYPEESCPLCATGATVDADHGCGREFLDMRTIFGDGKGGA